MSGKITGPNDPRVQAFLGKKFNRLIASRFLGMKGSAQFWEFKCDCGGTKNALITNVIKGLTGSCGCLHHEMLLRRNTIHGHAVRGKQHPLYKIWKGIHARCNSDDPQHFPTYKGKGIGVCERWSIYQNFFDDMSPTYQPGLEIERVDGKKGYSPDNCIWGDDFIQNRNKCTARMITYNGETLNASVWAERIGGNYNIIYVRLRRGWSPERAVSTPVLRK